ncbi:MAG: hypothetical protein HQ580_05595, partial [Planctomycetes bacterium]|nr:hypothetical protein [Planctomycetota bacterium]
MNFKKMLALAIINMIILAPAVVVCAQEGEDLPFVFEEVADAEEVASEESADVGEVSELQAAPTAPAAAPGGEVSGNVTLDFKDADIKNVLRILSYKGGVNIVAGKGVEGPVTIRLTDVPWEKALEVLLKTYDYGHEKDGNIITVTPMEVLTKKKMAELELAEVEPLITEIFNLQFVDATDAMGVVREQLSPRGKVTVFTKTVQKGWPFGAGGGASSGSSGVGGFGVIERDNDEPRAKTLVVTDINSYMDRVKKIISEIDIRPKQVLIETRIVEVNRDRLKDLGFDWGTGSTGAESAPVTLLDASGKNESKIGMQALSSQVASSIFDPKATGIDSTLASTAGVGFDSGFSLVFRKLTGLQFEVILHALEEDVESNTLSAPRIMTLDNQEAKILIGHSRPIIKSDVSSGESSSGVTQTLDYYQNLGIVLNVIPQVSAEDYINLVVHPAVYSTTDSVSATSTITGGTSVVTSYPIVLMREVDTQILLKSGETAVIGGLLKDVKKESVFSVPILGDLPIVGFLFRRETTDIEKVDLLIFLTARVVEDGEAGLTDYG